MPATPSFLTHTNAKLASEAIETLLTDAAIPLEQIEGLACGTSSADQLIPSHANMVAGEIGMAPAEIVSTAGVCASGMSGPNSSTLTWMLLLVAREISSSLDLNALLLLWR